MWHKAIWKGHPVRLELTRVGLLVQLANHYTVTAYDSTINNIGYLNIHWTKITANDSTINNIGYLNIQGTHVTANDSI